MVLDTGQRNGRLLGAAIDGRVIRLLVSPKRILRNGNRVEWRVKRPENFLGERTDVVTDTRSGMAATVRTTRSPSFKKRIGNHESPRFRRSSVGNCDEMYNTCNTFVIRRGAVRREKSYSRSSLFRSRNTRAVMAVIFISPKRLSSYNVSPVSSYVISVVRNISRGS